MRLQGLRIGVALTGSHCTLDKVIPEIERIVADGAKIYPIFSESVSSNATRFGSPEKWLGKLSALAEEKVITTIVDAEPIGPKQLLDVLVVAPCTGNTLAKLANGITDTPVLMACKAQLRNRRPVVLAIATNDGLGNNAKNIGLLLNTKNIYLVPFGQDDPYNKANSLMSRMDLIIDTIEYALQGKQIQPVLIQYAVGQESA